MSQPPGWRERLSAQMQQRVIAALERYAGTGYGNLDRIEGTGDQGRLRVGDWRVRFRMRIDQRETDTGQIEVRIVEVLIVRHRSAAYRDL